MSTGVIKSMLLLEEPNILGLRIGIENYSKAFLTVVFIGALIWQFVTDMKFIGVVKNLVLALVFIGCFYEFHTKAVDLSFKASEDLLREVSPRNIFLKRWNEVKVKTTDSSNSSFIEKIAIPNLNDLLGTALFLLSKVCILILKLIYTTVYHFTYIFAPITAIISFLPISKNSMAGTITSSLWCILLPLVLVVFLALVGNSIQMPAENGQLAISSMDQLIWIFGITVLMLLAPSFTFSLIKGSIASTADAVGLKMTGIGAKALVGLPIAYGLVQKVLGKGKKGGKNNFKSPQSFQPYSKKYSPDRMPNLRAHSNNNQTTLKSKEGLNSERSNQSTIKVSELKNNNQVEKQNGLAPNLLNQEKGNSKIVSSKIPFGSLISDKNLKQTTTEGINRGIKNNPNSGFSLKGSRFNSAFTTQPSKQGTTNIFKQDHLLKRTETKSKFERFKPSNLKKLVSKGRLNEV
jgi:hypothetical protein